MKKRGRPATGKKMFIKNFSLDKETIDSIVELSETNNCSESQIVRLAIAKYKELLK